jgi:hypothetical protein
VHLKGRSTAYGKDYGISLRGLWKGNNVHGERLGRALREGMDVLVSYIFSYT